MIVREAKHGDEEDIWRLANQFQQSHEYKDRLGELDPERVGQVFNQLLDGNNGTILLLEDSGDAVGFLALYLYPHLFSGEWIASEVAWWVDPEHRGGGVKLMRKAEKWAKDKAAKRFHMIAPHDRVAKFYERLGFELLERHYQKDL